MSVSNFQVFENSPSVTTDDAQTAEESFKPSPRTDILLDEFSPFRDVTSRSQW